MFIKKIKIVYFKHEKNLILEICQNHNGSESLLKEMIHASETGATKFRTYIQENLPIDQNLTKGFQKMGKIYTIKRPFKDEYKRLKKLDMKKDFISNFVKFCSIYNIKPMITPFTYGSYYRIKNKGVKFIKIASYDCSSLNFLEKMNL